MRDETRYEKVEETASGYKYLKLKSGRRVMFHDAQREADDNFASVARWLSRMAKLTGAHEYADFDWEQIGYFLDHMETLAEHYRAEIRKHDVHTSKKERIAQLRNVKGRSAEEAALYLAKADQLEKEMNDE